MVGLEFYTTADWRREVTERRQSADEPYRTAARRDYARLIHAPAFRRLQRKTQLFPGDESDFFRNRITHSLEVAQIAKSIAIRLNHLIGKAGYKSSGIDTDLIELAGLAHDIGHPPFGHTGEFALDECMRDFGGFEGNAQTLRILSRIEKKRTKHSSGQFEDYIEFADGEDLRAGQNLTFRSLASIVKYDNVISEHRGPADPLTKGYYASEAPLVTSIKKAVLGKHYKNYPLETVEMQIMDLADDIAYSTYDFEDAMKGGFTSPLDILTQVNNNEELRDSVAEKLFKSKYKRTFTKENASPEDKTAIDELKTEMERAVINVFSEFLERISDYAFDEIDSIADIEALRTRWPIASIFALTAQKFSNMVQQSGYNRVLFTSSLIGRRIKSIKIDVNPDVPALSRVLIENSERFEMDVMKHLTYELQIRSPRLRVLESRGKQIVSDLFKKLTEDADGELLPADWRSRIRAIRQFPNFHALRMRLVADYIAGMTDAYALDSYARFTSANHATLFRPM